MKPRLLEPIGVYEILAALAPEVDTYLGIGVQEGECVRHVVDANPFVHVTLCDTWGGAHGGTNRGSHDHVAEKLRAAKHRGLVTFLDGRSQDLIPQLPRTPQFDLAYVDGAHDTASELEDLSQAWPRTRSVMVVHDVFFPEVWTALTCWLALHPMEVALLQIAPGFTGTAIIWRRP